MNLNELVSLLQSGNIKANVTADSRKVAPGDIFVAVKGTAVDGHDFIMTALEKGALCIVCQQRRGPLAAQEIVVDDSHKAWAILAQAQQGDPAKKLINLAVTGTNGKTTTAYLVRSIINTAGHKCGLIGTVAYDTGNGSVESNMTTPDASSLASMMAQMVEAGSKFMVIEASSHALSQKRLAGIDFTAAAFTNLTGDHLDYHKDMQNYLSAKALLFEGLSPQAFAILNKQSPASADLAKRTSAKVLYFSINETADIRADIVDANSNSTIYDLSFNGQTVRVNSPLLGMHNVSNHLTAAGLCLAAGIALATVAKGLENLTFVPGRLQSVRQGQPYAVLVDYAHTDDALTNVLNTLNPICKGELTVVFGCGGDRDKTKRPRMAKTACQLADKVVITSDNPRTEDPNTIINDIVAGIPSATALNITIEPDRKKAIQLALAAASPDDIILIAGKGHENYQIIGKEKHHFSDTEVVEEFLKNAS